MLFLSRCFREGIRFDLRSRRLFYFHVSGSEVEEEVFTRDLVSRIHRLPVREVEFEFHRLVFRIGRTRYRISAGERICGEVRSVYEKYCGTRRSARRSRIVSGFRYPELGTVAARKSGDRYYSVVLGVSENRCRQVRIGVRAARGGDRSRFRKRGHGAGHRVSSYLEREPRAVSCRRDPPAY